MTAKEEEGETKPTPPVAKSSTQRLQLKLSSSSRSNSSNNNTTTGAATSTSTSNSNSNSSSSSGNVKTSNFGLCTSMELLHQSIDLHVVYDNDSSSSWKYRGYTDLYVLCPLPSSENKKMRKCDVSLQLRDCMKITNLSISSPSIIQSTNKNDTSSNEKNETEKTTSNDQPSSSKNNVEPSTTLNEGSAATTNTSTTATAAASTTTTTTNTAIMKSLYVVSQYHLDPLRTILQKPASTYNATTDINNKESFEADSHCSRGAMGMTDSLRCASLTAQTCGQVQLTCLVPSSSSSLPEAKNQSNLIRNCWKKDILQNCKKYKTQYKQQKKLRDDRIQFITQQLSKHSTTTATEQVALKVSIQFELDNNINNDDSTTATTDGNLHLGGINFISSSSSGPYVYTTPGLLGDMTMGVTCWVPTLDSGKSQHRASRTLTVNVTAETQHGLWPTGCGHDFGWNVTVRYYSHLTKKLPTSERHSDFLRSTILADTRNTKRLLATSIWNNCLWLPCSSRSLGFVIGPFDIHYDTEYYDNDDEPSSKDEEDKEQQQMNSTVATTTGEGIRQLYLVPKSERYLIHDHIPVYSQNNNDDDDGGDEATKNTNGSKNQSQEHVQFFGGCFSRKSLLHHIMSCDNYSNKTSKKEVVWLLMIQRMLKGVTSGVTHRALSLMTDVLGLPSCGSIYTNSFTQVWLPLKGECSGTLSNFPSINGCGHVFYGGCVLNGCMLPPISTSTTTMSSSPIRWPFYRGGRDLQLLQARCAIRSWILSKVPIGGDDVVGNSYIHTLFECVLLSLYERVYGASGEGGGTDSWYCIAKQMEHGVGLFHSPIFDSLFPITNCPDTSNSSANGGGHGGIPGHSSSLDDKFHSHSVSMNVDEEDDDFRSKNEQQLWRNEYYNGTESRTTAQDEYFIECYLYKDILEALEIANKPTPGWMGSSFCTTFLSSNSSCSTKIGCGTVELCHPLGGAVYRFLKCTSLAKLLEARAGISNLIRIIRIAFLAAHLQDNQSYTLSNTTNSADNLNENTPNDTTDDKMVKDQTNENKKLVVEEGGSKVPFIVCLEEVIKKGGLTHGSFTRIVRVLSGPIREPYLRGTLVDVCPSTQSQQPNLFFLEPEGYPNSYIRGASCLYLRVGTHVEPTNPTTATGTNSSYNANNANQNNLQLQVIAEPVLTDQSIAFGGPVTLRIVENEGQCREFVRTLPTDGSRVDWGPIFLLAKPVSTPKDCTAASGSLETTTTTTTTTKSKNKSSNSSNNNNKNKNSSKNQSNDSNNPNDSSSKNKKGDAKGNGTNNSANSNDNNDNNDSANTSNANNATSNTTSVYSEEQLHRGGYCALELVRLTNLTPLLWVRVDPLGFYPSRMSISLPEACLAEQLFHDGDVVGQIHAMRALAERPHPYISRLQHTDKYYYNAKVSELPVRLLGDCLRGSTALHSDIPHNPAVRAQAAYCLAQWQNNKAPKHTHNSEENDENWIGLTLLLQYFRERFMTQLPNTTSSHKTKSCVLLPPQFTRTILRKKENDDEMDDDDNNNKKKKNSADAHSQNLKPSSTNKNLNNTTITPKTNPTNSTSNRNRAGNLNRSRRVVSSAYHYLDEFTHDKKEKSAWEDADEIELEEDEEYRVRSAVMTAIACIRGKEDGLTPKRVVDFFQMILQQEQDEPAYAAKPTPSTTSKQKLSPHYSVKYSTSFLIADALLATTYIHVQPPPTTTSANSSNRPPPNNTNTTQNSPTDNIMMGTTATETAPPHPCQRLLDLAYQWLEWDLYRQDLRSQQHPQIWDVFGNDEAYSIVSASAITSFYTLGLLKQCTDTVTPTTTGKKRKQTIPGDFSSEDATNVLFYLSIYNHRPKRCDITRAAAAQAITSIYCASDRFDDDHTNNKDPTGLLTALEFLLEQINGACCNIFRMIILLELYLFVSHSSHYKLAMHKIIFGWF